VHSHGSNAVRGDSARLHQVVADLFDNAIKFTQEGCDTSVGLSLRVGQSDAVAVNGQGIALECRPHLFDRFQQKDRSRMRRHRGQGLGLGLGWGLGSGLGSGSGSGLSIVRQLVQLQ